MTAPASVAAYLAAQPPATRRVLAAVRKALRAALPGAEEVISYGIPAYRRDGLVVIFFAGWAKHFSLYPVTAPLVAELGTALDGYAQSKGTVRFPLDGGVPVRLVQRIARLRAAQAAAPKAQKKTKKPAAKAKPASKKAPPRKAAPRKPARK